MLIKESDTIAVDVTSKGVQELVERLSVCVSVTQADNEALEPIERLRDQLADALTLFRRDVRKLGFLPADGNVELAEIEALLIKAKAILGADSEIAVMTQNLHEQASLALNNIDQALGEVDVANPAVTVIARLRACVADVNNSLSDPAR